MNPLGPEKINAQPYRLPQRQVRRGGGNTGDLGMVGGFLFGGLFVGIGSWMLLAGLKVIPIDANKLHAPFWVFALFGFVFLLPGLWVWSGTFRSRQFSRRRLRSARLHQQSPAMADHPWDARQSKSDCWAPARQAGFIAVFVSIFMTASGYIVFSDQAAPVFVKIIVSIFIPVAVWCWISFFREVWHGWKFGATAIAYTRFPIRLGENAELRWIPPPRLLNIESGQVALRCVREWTEVSGSGKNRTSKLCHESLWESVRKIETALMIRPADNIELSFMVPTGQSPTCLANTKQTIFWELEVKLAVPGLDFKEGYLVPIYV